MKHEDETQPPSREHTAGWSTTLTSCALLALGILVPVPAHAQGAAEAAPPADAPAGDAPAGDAPAGDAPAGDAPAADAPAGDAPAADAPAADAPAGDAPATDAPAADAPAASAGDAKAEGEATGDTAAAADATPPAAAAESTTSAAPDDGKPEPPPPMGPNGIPGSPRPPGLSLSPHAPPTPPAPGGRAPSFGTPEPPQEWTFGVTGRMSGYEMVGFGRRSNTAPEDSEGQALHVPPESPKPPYWAGAAFTLNMVYGNPRVSANVTFNANLNGIERRGYYMSNTGPDIATAYLAFSPEPIGALQLRAKVGAYRENYAGPGQWGWGVFGPLIGLKGYGETLSGEYPLTPKVQLSFAHGLLATPGVPEDFVRGDATGWTENAKSTWVNHGHLGLSFNNQYVVKVHAASAQGTDEQTYLADVADTVDDVETARDGHMNAYALELRATADPYGQFGVSGGFWDMKHAEAVHDGIFWGIGWTAGGREMSNNYLGANSDGNGKIVALSAEYSLSLARIIWHPRAFDGRAPDIRAKLAAVVFNAIESDDPDHEGKGGYNLGSELEYQLARWVSANVRAYAENRQYGDGRWVVDTLTSGFIFRRDWQSQDRIELAYSRLYYSHLVDINPSAPLDRDIVTLGAVMSF